MTAPERCQTPTAVSCGEPAEFYMTLPEPGLNMPPATLEVCAFHADELRRDCAGEIVDTVAPTAPDVIVTIPDTCPPVAVGPMNDDQLRAWAIDEAIRRYSAEWAAHPEWKPGRWGAGDAITNLIGDGYVVAELHAPTR